NLGPWLDGFRGAVDDAVHLLLASVPEALPCHDFRILKQQAPESDEGAVRGAGAAQRPGHPLVQFHVTLPRALGIDSLIAPLAHAVLAEAIDGSPARRSEVRADCVVQRALSFGLPHE